MVSQACAASLRLIPSYAHALGVAVGRSAVTLVVQAPPDKADDDEDIADIVSELEALLGPEVVVTSRVEEQESPQLSPTDGVWWFFAARP